MSSSSSSSSIDDYSGEKILPFFIDIRKQNPCFSIAYYKNLAFLGDGNQSILISENRYHWGDYYKIKDSHVSCLKIIGNYLYASSSPLGKIYRFDLEDNSVNYYGEFNSKSISIEALSNKIYFCFYNGDIYQYNENKDRIDLFYTAQSNVLTSFVFNGKLYLGLKDGRIISYNQEKWESENISINNFRNIPNHFSFSDFEILNKTESNDILRKNELYPINKNIGISKITNDGNAFLIGSNNRGRIYQYINDNVSLLYDTDLNAVHDIYNIELGLSLASIGNKLYVIYLKSINTDEESPTTETQNETVDNSSFKIISPKIGDQFENGQDIEIQWESSENYNSLVKIDLIDTKSENNTSSISTQTLNDGSFNWEIPLSLPQSEYKIKIQFLTSNNSGSSHESSPFSISFTTTTTTTTTTLPPNPLDPPSDIKRITPILILPDDECIIKISKDKYLNSILLLTNRGRILNFDKSFIGGYLTGYNTIYATVLDGFLNANTFASSFMYYFINKIAEINEYKSINKWKHVEKASISKSTNIMASFISPAFYVQEDLGIWKTLIWSETSIEQSDVTVSVRSSDSIDNLKTKPWEFTFIKSAEDLSTNIVKDLQGYDLNGRYFQVKVEIRSSGDISSIVHNINVIYTTKQTSYFFSEIFSLEKDSNINQGIITATINEPLNTEVKFGISDKNTSDWNSYQLVELDKFFPLNNLENIKIGVKFSSYDVVNIPDVSEFALLCSGDKKEILK